LGVEQSQGHNKQTEETDNQPTKPKQIDHNKTQFLLLYFKSAVDVIYDSRSDQRPQSKSKSHKTSIIYSYIFDNECQPDLIFILSTRRKTSSLPDVKASVCSSTRLSEISGWMMEKQRFGSDIPPERVLSFSMHLGKTLKNYFILKKCERKTLKCIPC